MCYCEQNPWVWPGDGRLPRTESLSVGGWRGAIANRILWFGRATGGRLRSSQIPPDRRALALVKPPGGLRFPPYGETAAGSGSLLAALGGEQLQSNQIEPYRREFALVKPPGGLRIPPYGETSPACGAVWCVVWFVCNVVCGLVCQCNVWCGVCVCVPVPRAGGAFNKTRTSR